MSLRKLAFQALVASSVVAYASAAFAQAPSTQDLVGTWNLTLTSPQGSHPGTVTVKEEAGKLSGVLSGGALGTLPVDVKTSEAGVVLSFSLNHEGSPVPVVLTGKVAGTSIKGVVDYANGAATGDFTGTKGDAAVAAVAGASAGVGVTGAWAVTSEGGGGYSFNLKQDGTAVSGTLKTPDGAEVPVKGTLESNALTLAVAADGLSGTIKGTLEGAALKGSYDLGGNTGSWTATRKP